MSKVQPGITALLGLSSLLGTALNSFAAIVTSVSPIASPGAGNTSYLNSFSVSVAPFNTALGTLTDVSIDIAVSAGDVIYVAPAPANADDPNTSYETSQPYNDTLNYSFLQLLTPDSNSFPAITTAPSSSTPFTQQAEPPTLPVTYSGTTPSTDIHVTVGTLATPISYSYDVPSADLNELSGQSSTSVAFAVDTGVVMFSVNDSEYAGNLGSAVGDVTGTATVTYTYTPIPEPEAINWVGMAGMLACCRSRQLRSLIA